MNAILREVLSMSTTNINIKIDADVKRPFENFCVNAGISVTSAVTSFVRTVTRTVFELISNSEKKTTLSFD
jgi:antitoxin component of RelBE/YafQ-DinJ toxin-antitoxin module